MDVCVCVCVWMAKDRERRAGVLLVASYYPGVFSCRARHTPYVQPAGHHPTNPMNGLTTLCVRECRPTHMMMSSLQRTITDTGQL